MDDVLCELGSIRRFQHSRMGWHCLSHPLPLGEKEMISELTRSKDMGRRDIHIVHELADRPAGSLTFCTGRKYDAPLVEADPRCRGGDSMNRAAGRLKGFTASHCCDAR